MAKPSCFIRVAPIADVRGTTADVWTCYHAWYTRRHLAGGLSVRRGMEFWVMNSNLWDAEDLLALRMAPGVGPVTMRRLCALATVAQTPLRALFGRSLRELAERLSPGAQKLAAHLEACSPALQARATELLRVINARGIHVTPFGSTDYPPSLETALGQAAPALLFVWGARKLLMEPAAGIVGTRKPSVEGARLARECAAVFAEAGIPVVSGGARGIDTAAHLSTLDAGGQTIVVLPQGLLTYRVPSAYADAIKSGRVLLLSDCVPDAPWQTRAAVARNAVISALAHVLCVIEPRSLGGSLKTARHSLAQGKPVLYAGLRGVGERLANCPGAESLVRGSQTLDPERLLHAWKQPITKRPRQVSLL